MAFCLSACQQTDGPVTVKSDCVQVSGSWSPARSLKIAAAGLPIDFYSDNSNVLYEVHAREGSFTLDINDFRQRASDVTVHGGETVRWTYYSPDDRPEDGWNEAKTFIEIIFIENKRYVGYAIVMIEHPDGHDFTGTVIECLEFPKVNGSYQKITLKMILQMMDEAEQKA